MTNPNPLALVTGAGSGIGRATAKAMVKGGWRVVCAGRRLEPLQTLAKEAGEGALPITLDITDTDSVDSLLERLPDEWRAIRALVNNAGMDTGGRLPFHAAEADTYAKIIETNLIGTIRVTRALIDVLRDGDTAHIVNIGSTAGLEPYATGTIYSASKHGMHGFSESLRMDYAGSGLRVSEIMPGMVETDFALNRWGDRDKADQFYKDYGTCLSPEDVANAVVYVLQQPSHVTISQLVIRPDN